MDIWRKVVHINHLNILFEPPCTGFDYLPAAFDLDIFSSQTQPSEGLIAQ
jgi:hypothetical protein